MYTKISEEKRITLKKFTQMISEETGFSFKDSQIFMNAFRTIIHRIIKQKKSFIFPYVFLLNITKTAPYRAWDGLHKRYFDGKARYRIVFTPSAAVRRLIKENLDPVEEFFENIKE